MQQTFRMLIIGLKIVNTESDILRDVAVFRQPFDNLCNPCHSLALLNVGFAQNYQALNPTGVLFFQGVGCGDKKQQQIKSGQNLAKNWPKVNPECNPDQA